MGFIFQFFNLQDYLTAKENVALPALIAKKNYKQSIKKAEALLERVGLGDMMNKPVKQMSGGQMQRVAIARALINDPKLILADEPTGALDKKNAEIVLDLFEEISKSGVSLVVITHDLSVAERFDNTLHINKGKAIKK